MAKLTTFIQKVYTNHEMPKEMKNSITTPIQREDKRWPGNYQGITLIKFNLEVENRDEKMGFLENKATTQAI